MDTIRGVTEADLDERHAALTAEIERLQRRVDECRTDLDAIDRIRPMLHPLPHSNGTAQAEESDGDSESDDGSMEVRPTEAILKTAAAHAAVGIRKADLMYEADRLINGGGKRRRLLNSLIWRLINQDPKKLVERGDRIYPIDQAPPEVGTVPTNGSEEMNLM